MNTLDAIKKFSSVAIAVAYPPAAPLVAAVNALLPDEQRMPNDCTGDMLGKAIDMLAPGDRETILKMELDHAEKMAGHKASAMNAANSNSNENYQVTRAYIAKQSFHAVAGISFLFMAFAAAPISSGDAEMVNAILSNWAAPAAVTAPFVAMLYAYIGVLKTEYRDRLNAANGKTAIGSLGALAAIMRKK